MSVCKHGGDVLGQFQTPYFTSAELNANKGEQTTFFLFDSVHVKYGI